MNYDFKPLEELLGNRFSTGKFERHLYSKDLAPLPEIITLLFKTTPDAVVRPKTPEEVSEIMKFANKNKINVTPRASATSALGNVVPTRAGIVMDMSSTDSKIEINEAEETATVSSGVVWKKLEKALNKKGLSLMTYPSSAPSATVGGWLSSPGYGIGSLKYGRVYEQVLGIELVLPNGEIKKYFGKDEEKEKNKFLGTEGTTGIITEAKLKVRKFPEAESVHLLNFDNQKNFCVALLKLVKLNPFNISYASKNYAEMAENSDAYVSSLHESSVHEHTEHENAKHENRENGHSENGHIRHEHSENGHNVNFKFRSLIVFDGSKKSVEESVKNLNNIKKSEGIIEESSNLAEEEWNARFNPMKIKRGGPTLLAGDILIPLSRLDSVITLLNKINIDKLGIEGTVVSQDKVIVMPMYLTDERKFFDFVFALRHIKKMNDIAVSAGGVPYGTGLWNSPYLNKILGKEELKEKKELKRQIDENNILNPDKYLGAKLAIPKILFNPAIYRFSMLSAEIASKPLRLAGLIK